MDEEVKHASHKVARLPGHINSESTNNRYLSTHTFTTTTDSLKGSEATKSSKDKKSLKDTKSSTDTQDSGITHNKHGSADDPHKGTKDGLKFNVNGRGFPDVSAYGSNFFVVLGGR